MLESPKVEDIEDKKEQQQRISEEEMCGDRNALIFDICLNWTTRTLPEPNGEQGEFQSTTKINSEAHAAFASLSLLCTLPLRSVWQAARNHAWQPEEADPLTWCHTGVVRSPFKDCNRYARRRSSPPPSAGFDSMRKVDPSRPSL